MNKLIYKIIPGKTKIRISGLNIESIVSELCRNYNASNITRKGYTVLIAEIDNRRIPKLCEFIEIKGISYTIINNNLILKLYSVISKWWVILTILLLSVFTVILSSLCLNVEVTATGKISELDICNFLSETEKVVFRFKKDINIPELTKKLYASFPQATSIYLQMDGTTLKANIISEEKNKESISAETIPSDIISEKNGVIKYVNIKKGNANVKIGERVKPGDVLISGSYEKNDVLFNVNAKGDVIASVDYLGYAKCDKNQKTYTEENLLSICLFNKEIWTIKGKTAVQRNKTYHLMKNYPPCLKIISVSEKMIPSENTGFDNTEINLREKAYYNALKKIDKDANITDFHSEIVYNGSKIEAYAVITVTENIGVTSALPREQ